MSLISLTDIFDRKVGRVHGDFICVLSCDVDETLVGKIVKRGFLALQGDEARW